MSIHIYILILILVLGFIWFVFLCLCKNSIDHLIGGGPVTTPAAETSTQGHCRQGNAFLWLWNNQVGNMLQPATNKQHIWCSRWLSVDFGINFQIDRRSSRLDTRGRDEQIWRPRRAISSCAILSVQTWSRPNLHSILQACVLQIIFFATSGDTVFHC